MSHAVSVRAPAKVNLFLRVLDRRPDGFHQLETLFQAIDYADDVLVALDGPSGVSVDVAGANVGPAEDNLAYRAAKAYQEEAALNAGIRISLTKRIPAGAGLGGGSSDAAAVLRALDHLTEGALLPAELHGVASALGSDVPFFLCGSTLALGRGRGELLEPVDPLPEVGLLLMLPPVHVSTKSAYEALARPLAPAGAGETRLTDPPRSWDDVVSSARNDFEAVVAEAHPEVRRSLAALRRRGHPLVLLSGSGGACFAVAGEGADVQEDADELARELGWACVATRTLRGPPAVGRTPVFG